MHHSKSKEFKLINTQHTTHNTQQTTRNKQHSAHNTQHFQPDISQFPLENVIFGPLEVIPRIRDSCSFNVPKYQELKDHFNIVAKLDRKLILPCRTLNSILVIYLFLCLYYIWKTNAFTKNTLRFLKGPQKLHLRPLISQIL